MDPSDLVRMTSSRIDGHPAPWPLFDLDMAAMRAAGHQPTPLRQFILKIHSRCNLSCSYCYVYEMADQAWRQMPKRMSCRVAEKAIERIAEHAQEHDLASVDIILHGGEPLLTGAEWLADLIETLRARVRAQVNVSLQTNGTLLDRPMLETLKGLHVRVGVSLDGDAEATGRHRRYANGRNSFEAIADGLQLLESPEFRECYGGILCTIDVRNDPVSTYETLLKFSPPALDFLLPHANWNCPPPGTGYADWLIRVFERWYSAPRQETRIRMFSELIQLVLGQPGAVEGLGLMPSTVVVVDTDGAIKQLDSLSSAYPGAADTGLHITSSSFDDALNHPTTVARQIGAAALSPKCQVCQVMEICGGGLYPHRFRRGEGFRNPSVYCADLLQLITHIRDRVIADISRLSAYNGNCREVADLTGDRIRVGDSKHPRGAMLNFTPAECDAVIGGAFNRAVRRQVTPSLREREGRRCPPWNPSRSTEDTTVVSPRSSQASPTTARSADKLTVPVRRGRDLIRSLSYGLCRPFRRTAPPSKLTARHDGPELGEPPTSLVGAGVLSGSA